MEDAGRAPGFYGGWEGHRLGVWSGACTPQWRRDRLRERHIGYPGYEKGALALYIRTSNRQMGVGRGLAVGVVLGLLTLLLPLMVLEEEQPELLPAQPTPAVTQPGEGEQAAAEGWDRGQTLRLLQSDGEVVELTMEEYLWRVVAAEMPASFEPQALQAQAVCARTYSLWKMTAEKHREAGADLCDSSACCQAYTTREAAMERWGSDGEGYAQRIAQAVAETDGQILTYQGKPIQAVFFSSSTQATEDAAAVWGGSLPYLVSVDSPEGEEVPNYHSTVTLTAEELAARVKQTYPEASLDGAPEGWLGEPSYTPSGRVAEMTVGGVTLSGGAARTLFGLRSACFQVSYGEGGFTFSVTGYGHGVGMSQYGANAMAKAGSTWQEIVSHYYTGVTIQRAEAD